MLVKSFKVICAIAIAVVAIVIIRSVFIPAFEEAIENETTETLSNNKCLTEKEQSNLSLFEERLNSMNPKERKAVADTYLDMFADEKEQSTLTTMKMDLVTESLDSSKPVQSNIDTYTDMIALFQILCFAIAMVGAVTIFVIVIE